MAVTCSASASYLMYSPIRESNINIKFIVNCQIYPKNKKPQTYDTYMCARISHPFKQLYRRKREREEGDG